MNAQSMKRTTRRFVEIMTLCVSLLAAEHSFAQAKPAPQLRGAEQAGQAGCLILERLGIVGQVTSRVLSFGVNGSHFQYVEGQLPEGVTFHNKLTEHDVRNLQASGSDVIILDSDYLPDDLTQARESCQAAARKSPSQANTAQMEIASSPAGSDIELDGKFVGSTPSLVKVATGDHTIKLMKNGYATWERKVTTMSGSVRISPDLQPIGPITTEDTSASFDSTASNKY
jgi:hypothetical protein